MFSKLGCILYVPHFNSDRRFKNKIMLDERKNIKSLVGLSSISCIRGLPNIYSSNRIQIWNDIFHTSSLQNIDENNREIKLSEKTIKLIHLIFKGNRCCLKIRFRYRYILWAFTLLDTTRRQ